MNKEKTIEVACKVLERIRSQAPLVLCMTNTVVQPITANLLLATGAVPAMLCDGKEAAEMIRACTSAMLINVGTLSREQATAMEIAIQTAHETNVPWVLDPVAVGLLGLRTKFVKKILSAGTPPALIRGNASEILAVAGYNVKTRGPESTCESDAACEAALKLAKKIGCPVLITGEIDYVTDGKSLYAFANGDKIMTRVTGVGCAMGALCAACVAVADNPLEGAIASAILMGIAGEIAAKKAMHPGTFAVELLDAFDTIDRKIVQKNAKIVSCKN